MSAPGPSTGALAAAAVSLLAACAPSPPPPARSPAAEPAWIDSPPPPPPEMTRCVELGRAPEAGAGTPAAPPPACVSIRFSYDMSGALLMTRLLVVVDGVVLQDHTAPEGNHFYAENIRHRVVTAGAMAPGEHRVQVLVNMQGHGSGSLAYLKGYKLEVRSSHEFTAAPGALDIHIVAYEKHGPSRPLEERPAIRYIERVSPPRSPDTRGAMSAP